MTESDSMARAAELLDLIKSPTAIATGVLIAFTMRQLARNDVGTVDRPATLWAAAAATAAVVLAAAVVIVMTPLATRIMFLNRGDIETRLLVYALMYLVAVGTTIYTIWITFRCSQHLRAPH